jgi:hypothetical protein
MRIIILLVATSVCLVAGCASEQEPPGCTPIDAQAIAAVYAAEAAPIVATGACDGFTSRTCPALKPARDRFDAARAEWSKRCNGGAP